MDEEHTRGTILDFFFVKDNHIYLFVCSYVQFIMHLMYSNYDYFILINL